MTRLGIIAGAYNQNVERRPFSRFTNVPAEIAANVAWLDRALAWGDGRFTAEGTPIRAGR